MKIGLAVFSGIVETLLAELLVKQFGYFGKSGTEEKKAFLAGLSTAVIISSVQSYCLIAGETETMTYLLLSIMYCMLMAAAWIDRKVQLVPNRLVLTGLIVRVVILGMECLQSPDLAFWILRKNVISLLITFLVLMVIAVASRYSIGFGDVKLMCVMVLYCGLQRMYDYFFLALLCAAVVSVYLLVVKKKGRKYRMAFVPYLYIGYLAATVFMAGG